MDLQEQARLHTQIRDALQVAISDQEPVDAAALRSDRLCATGCWLHGHGAKRWAGNHAFMGLLEAHRDFHRAIGAIADQIARGQYAEARRALRAGSPLSIVTADLNAAFRRMKAAQESLAV